MNFGARTALTVTALTLRRAFLAFFFLATVLLLTTLPKDGDLRLRGGGLLGRDRRGRGLLLRDRGRVDDDRGASSTGGFFAAGGVVGRRGLVRRVAERDVAQAGAVHLAVSRGRGDQTGVGVDAAGGVVVEIAALIAALGEGRVDRSRSATEKAKLWPSVVTVTLRAPSPEVCVPAFGGSIFQFLPAGVAGGGAQFSARRVAVDDRRFNGRGKGRRGREEDGSGSDETSDGEARGVHMQLVGLPTTSTRVPRGAAAVVELIPEARKAAGPLSGASASGPGLTR